MSEEPGLRYRLDYELVTDGWEITFDDPPPVDVRHPDFELRLEAGHATVEMQLRCPNDLEARRIVEAYLEAWAINTLLDSEAGDFHFKFCSAAISDRERSSWRPPSSVRVSQSVIEVLMAPPTARQSYPAPPTDFRADDLVLRMWRRWRRYLARRDGLSHVAYFCLEEVEWVAGSNGNARRAAATWLDITKPVLDKLGFLANHRGSDLDARHRQATPYSAPEQLWVETVVKALIRRAGQKAAGVETHPLTMADFPRL
jgi:hypothetical protein